MKRCCCNQGYFFFLGNPFPPLIFDGSRNKNLIHNILLEEARKEHRKEQYAEIVEKVTSSEKQQKNVDVNLDVKKSMSKAAQDVSEGEEFLKCVRDTSDENLIKSDIRNENNLINPTM